MTAIAKAIPGVMSKFRLTELSGVTRPAQSGARAVFMKRADDGEVCPIIKRAFTDEKRKALASSGAALPDGCFSGDTLVETLDGVRTIASIVGAIPLLTERGWLSAEVRHFGEQRLAELRLSRGSASRYLLVTLGHRWHTDRGIVRTAGLRSGDLLPQISRDRFVMGLEPSELAVARATQQSANLAGDVVVVDVECGPLTSRPGVRAGHPGSLSTNRASTGLCGEHLLELGVADPVFSPECTFASAKPARVAEIDSGSRLFGVRSLAGFALGSPTPALPDIEFAGRLAYAAEPTAAPSRVARKCSGEDAACVSRPVSPQSLVMGAAEPDGSGSALATLDLAGIDGGWIVEDVRLTGLIEPVYCGVVPGLHRFVLADGLLTGNSFPIETKSDLANAVTALGRAKDKDAAKRHIIARAKALGASATLPESWSVSKAGDVADLNQKGAAMSVVIKKALGLAETATDAEVEAAVAKLANPEAATKLAKAEAKSSFLTLLAKARPKDKEQMKADDVEPDADDEPDSPKAKKAIEYLSKSVAERDAIIAKRETGDEVLQTAGGSIRKSEVGPGVFAILKSQEERIAAGAEEIRKAGEINATLAFTKRATDEFGHIAGSIPDRVSVLRHIAKADEATQKAFETIFKAAEATAKLAFTKLGHLDGKIVKADGDPEAELEKLAKARQTESAGKLSFEKAYDEVIRERPELYAQAVAAKPVAGA